MANKKRGINLKPNSYELSNISCKPKKNQSGKVRSMKTICRRNFDKEYTKLNDV